MSSRILITDGQERSMLAVSRSLCEAGYLVSAATHARPAAVHWSRTCSERFRVPDALRDSEGFVLSLEKVLRSGDYAALLPGSDPSLLAISASRERLRGVRVGLPPHDVVERSLDKLLLTKAAASAGLSCPRTIQCSGYGEAESAARELDFPVVLKPKRSVFQSNGSMWQESSVLVWNDSELAEVIPRFGNPCLVQQAREGSVFSCAGVIAGDQLLGFAASRYCRTWPADGGPVSFSETVSPPAGLKPRIQALLSSIGWQGIFEVELILTSEGTFSAIDLNPRPYGSLALSVRAGAPLPVLWCDWLLARNPRPATARSGVKYRWEDADARHFWWQLRRRRIRAALAVLRPHRKVAHAFFEMRDPAPLVARLLYAASTRSLAGRLLMGGRPFFSRRSDR